MQSTTTGENHLICSGLGMISCSPCWRIRWIQSTIETQGGWMTMSIDIDWPTQPKVCSLDGWNSRTTTT